MSTIRVGILKPFFLLGTCLVSFAIHLNPAFADGSWSAIKSPLSNEPLQLIRAANPASPALLAASKSLLHRSADNGQSWETSFQSSHSAAINDVRFSIHDPNRCYLLTTNGLYGSNNLGKEWGLLYKEIGKERGNVLSLAEHPADSQFIYIGTAQGVVITKNGGKSWAHAFSELSRESIRDIVTDPINNEIFFATRTKVYRYHALHDSFKQVFTAGFSIDESEDSVFISDSDDLEPQDSFISRVITPHDSVFDLMLATKRGVFASSDEGETWSPLTTEGLQSLKIVDLAYSRQFKILFAATAKGIYRYDHSRKYWSLLNDGLYAKTSEKIELQTGRQEKLLTVNEKGIFQIEIDAQSVSDVVSIPKERWAKLKLLTQSEPSVREIQSAAIRYANVGNGKIQRWHAGSRLRTLLPDVSFSKGLDVDNNIHVDTGSTSTPDAFVQFPDDRGKTTDISLSWDLGDLVWSSNQTSIDSREKLMVELRDEILGEVTRLYFERRRAQFDLLTRPNNQPAECWKQILRIEELTANLDALTGGFMTKHLGRIYSKNPELNDFLQLPDSENIRHV